MTLPARDRQYDLLDVMESVTAVIGFEVIGSRFSTTSPGDGSPLAGEGSLYGSFSDHIANGGIVVGDSIPGWREIVVRRCRASNDRGRSRSHLRGGLPSLRQPVSSGGRRSQPAASPWGVKAGDIIVTNSSTSFFPVSADTLIRARYQGLGEVTATFERAG